MEPSGVRKHLAKRVPHLVLNDADGGLLIKKDAIATIRRTPRAFSLMPESLGDAMEMGKMIAASDFAPKDYKNKPGNVVIAIQMGADLGLKPMQSLQNIAVINGRPSIYGDAALALVLGADILEDFSETYEGTEGTDQFTAVCVAKRKGMATAVRRTFSIADAKAANLWGKQGPWTQYWKRMLLFRARGFTLRDVGSDVLMGLILAEEAMDYPSVIDVTPQANALPAGPTLLERLPEADREHIGKAFDLCNLPAGLRLTKLNEYLGGDGVDQEVGVKDLLNWCRDEYAKQKTGQPRVLKGDGNGKNVAPAAPQSAAPPADPAAPARPVVPVATQAIPHAPKVIDAELMPTARPIHADEIFKQGFAPKTETLKKEVGF